MMSDSSKRIIREITFIVVLSMLIALVYNSFSSKGISLIRKQISKIDVSDSALFTSSNPLDSSRIALLPYTTVRNDGKVIAPIHDQALRNPDSMARLYKETHDRVYEIITIHQLNRLLSERRGVLIDARNTEEYQNGFIHGARNIPAMDADNHFKELTTIPKDTLIIIYCNNAECNLAHVLADFMNLLEFTRIYIYDSGWDGWVDAGMPIDSVWRKE